MKREELEQFEKELSEQDTEQLERMLKKAKAPDKKEIYILIEKELDHRKELEYRSLQSQPTPEATAAYNDDEEMDDISASTPTPRLQPTASNAEEQTQQKEDTLRTVARTAGAAAAVAEGVHVAGGMEKASKTLGVRAAPKPAPKPVANLRPEPPVTLTSQAKPAAAASTDMRISLADMQNPAEFTRKILVLLRRPGEGGKLYAERISETMQEVEEKFRRAAGRMGQGLSRLNVSSAKDMKEIEHTVAHQARSLAQMAKDLLRNPMLHATVLGIMRNGAEKLKELAEEGPTVSQKKRAGNRLRPTGFPE